MTELPRPFTPHPRSVHDLLFAPGSRGVLIATSRDPDAKRTFIVTPPAGHLRGRPGRPGGHQDPGHRGGRASAITRETRMLVALRDAELGGLEPTVPRYLETLDSDGLPALVSTVVHGTPMSVAYHRWRHTTRPRLVAEDFALAGGWLRHFQSATAGERARITWAAEVSGAVRERWSGASPGSRPLRCASRAADRQLKSYRVARTMVHGDYWFGNLLVRDGADHRRRRLGERQPGRLAAARPRPVRAQLLPLHRPPHPAGTPGARASGSRANGIRRGHQVRPAGRGLAAGPRAPLPTDRRRRPRSAVGSLVRRCPRRTR